MLEPSIDPADWPVLKEYGETEPGGDGYTVRVVLVQAPRGAHRVRLQLRLKGREVKRIDLSGPLARRAVTLLAKATNSTEGEG